MSPRNSQKTGAKIFQTISSGISAGIAQLTGLDVDTDELRWVKDDTIDDVVNENITDTLPGSAVASGISMEDSPTDNLDNDSETSVVQSEQIQIVDRHVIIKCVDENTNNFNNLDSWTTVEALEALGITSHNLCKPLR